MLPECMTTKRPASLWWRAQSLSCGSGTTLAASPQFGITRSRSGETPFASTRTFIVSPITTTRSAARSDGSIRRRSSLTTTGFLSRPSLTAISGKTSCMMISSGARNRAATSRAIEPMNGGSVMQTTMSGRLESIARQTSPAT